MRNIDVKASVFDPANGVWDNYHEFVAARAGQDISSANSSFTIAEIPRKIMYVRTLDHDPSFDFSEDIVIMRCPTIYDEIKRDDKAASPFLETEHTITGTAVLRHDDIADIPIEMLSTFYENLIAAIVSKYGDPEKMEIRNNDLYYGGKKFGGVEATFGDDVTIGSCITLEYLPDKELIDSLPGRGNYEITGISEEVPTLTKDVLIQELVDGIRRFFESEVSDVGNSD